MQVFASHQGYQRHEGVRGHCKINAGEIDSQPIGASKPIEYINLRRADQGPGRRRGMNHRRGRPTWPAASQIALSMSFELTSIPFATCFSAFSSALGTACRSVLSRLFAIHDDEAGGRSVVDDLPEFLDVGRARPLHRWPITPPTAAPSHAPCRVLSRHRLARVGADVDEDGDRLVTPAQQATPSCRRSTAGGWPSPSRCSRGDRPARTMPKPPRRCLMTTGQIMRRDPGACAEGRCEPADDLTHPAALGGDYESANLDEIAANAGS